MILFLLINVSIFPIIGSSKLVQNSSQPNKISRDQIKILKQLGPVGTYEDYINSREDKPFIFQTQAIGPLSYKAKFKPPGFRYFTIKDNQITDVDVYSLHLKDKLEE